MITTLDSVSEAAVVAAINENGKDVLKAFIVKKNNALKVEEIVDFVSKHGPVKLEGGVEFTDKLPRNALGKIIRKYLLQESQKN